jgi:hypothetical protein
VQAANFAAIVIQINHIGWQQNLEQVWVAFGQKVVVSGNQHFVRVLLLAEPGQKVFHFCPSAFSGKIAAMDQHISFGESQMMVQSVGVRNKYQFHVAAKLQEKSENTLC